MYIQANFRSLFPIVTMASSKVLFVLFVCNIFGEPLSNGILAVSTATKLQLRGPRQTLEKATPTCEEGQKVTCTWIDGNRRASCSSLCNAHDVSFSDCDAGWVGLRTLLNAVNCLHEWQNKDKGPLRGKCNCSINQ